MRYYTRRINSYESISIKQIENGIKKIKRGGNLIEITKKLEFYFNKLEECNKPMYEQYYLEYCKLRIEIEKNQNEYSS